MKKNVGSNVITNMSNGVASFFSWPKSYCNLETTLQEIKGSCIRLPPFENEYLEWMWTSYPTPIHLICLIIVSKTHSNFGLYDLRNTKC